MPDPQFVFDERSAHRIAKAVRAVERTRRDAGTDDGARRTATQNVGLVRIFSTGTTDGLYPAVMLQIGEAIPLPADTTTTTAPQCSRYEAVGDGSQDCWLAMLPSDATPAVGDVHFAFSMGPVEEDGLPVFVKSDAACPNTTTTTPSPIACTGVCRWAWNAVTKLWALIASTCSTSCVCTQPQFCGSKDCEYTNTYCAPNPGQPTPYCGGNTTTTAYPGPPTTTTTSTTTTPAPGCTDSCVWRRVLSYWNRISNPCAASCPCPLPSGVGDDCATVSTPCTPVTTTPAPPATCTGRCAWYSDPDLAAWLFLYIPGSGCVSNYIGRCYCPPPSVPAGPCTIAYTACIDGQTGPTPTPTTSTTPTPTSCTGDCIFEWNGSAWVPRKSNCPSFCACNVTPPNAGVTTCDTATMPCGVTTSTTTTTTTTCAPTTTTSAPACGRCKVDWNGAAWVVASSTCAAGCTCSVPSSSGNSGCDRSRQIGCTANCTSTTTTCAPTTTNGPAVCGRCQYQSVAGPTSGGCPTFVWALMSNGCYGSVGCGSCPDPSSVCVQKAGEVMYRNCTGTPATTTTSTTTTSTTTCTPTTSTTTTCGPVCGPQPDRPELGDTYCCWLYYRAFGWSLNYQQCSSSGVTGCGCPPGPTGEGCEGQQICLPCQVCSGGTTTTTTTTAAPTCGQCTFTYFAMLGWVGSSLCTGECFCPSPPGSPGTPGETRTANCV